MRYTFLGIVLIVLGIFLLITGGFQGGLFIIFPFIVTNSPIGALGSLLIMVGIIALFFGMMADIPIHNTDIEGNRAIPTPEKRGIGFIIVGPVPLIIDTENRRLTLISIIVFITGIVVLLVLFFL
jgi:uncharacterized membrane protein